MDMTSISSLTNGQIMTICLLIFAAVLILPRLIRRRRIQKQIFEKKKKGEAIRPEDFKGNQKLFYTHNAQSSEVEELLVKLKSYAFKHEMKIVFPGSFHYKNQVSASTMVLIGKFGLLSIRCYGFGGHIYAEDGGLRFMQNMNEAIKEIPNPIRSMEQEEDLARLFLRPTGFKGSPVSSVSVFTRQNVILSVPEDSRIFDRKGFMDWLETEELFKEDNQVPVKQLADCLVASVKTQKQ